MAQVTIVLDWDEEEDALEVHVEADPPFPNPDMPLASLNKVQRAAVAIIQFIGKRNEENAPPPKSDPSCWHN